jgi:MFS family permease
MAVWKLFLFISFSGGFLYGYNAETMAGAVIFIENKLHLGSTYAEDLISARLWATLVAIAFSSWLVNRFGRKPILIVSTFFLAAGPGLTFFLKDYAEIDIGRWLTGFGLGLNSIVFILYLTEMTPKNLIGKILALYSASVSFGVLTSDVTNAFFSKTENWQLALGLMTIPAAVQLVYLFFIPESQVWLNHLKTATVPIKSFSQLWKSFLPKRKHWHVLALGMMLAALTEAIGLDTLFGYAPTLFERSGFLSSTTALWATTAVNIVQLAASLLIIPYLDRNSRKYLLKIGLIALGVVLMAMALAFWLIPISAGLPWVIFLLMLLLSGSYNFAFISVAWVLIPEMFPDEIRPTGLVLANLITYLLVVLLSQFYLDIANALGFDKMFLCFSLICFASIFFVSRFLIETKEAPTQAQLR